jgi:DDE superfamily endonuclease
VQSFICPITHSCNNEKISKSIVDDDSCKSIVKFRRWAQRIANNKLIFLDETAIRVSDAPRNTLVMPDEQPIVVVEDNSSYAARYDMIAVTTGTEVLPPVIFSPEDRETRGVDGIQGWMLNEYILDILARSIAALDRYPMYLVVDRSTAHNSETMMESFHCGGCFEIVDIMKMPTKAAKRISPLDNGIFHEWKDRVRKHNLLTSKNIESVMVQEWENISQENISHYYKHCGLTHGQDVYKDCPCPNEHQHCL